MKESLELQLKKLVEKYKECAEYQEDEYSHGDGYGISRTYIKVIEDLEKILKVEEKEKQT